MNQNVNHDVRGTRPDVPCDSLPSIPICLQCLLDVYKNK